LDTADPLACEKTVDKAISVDVNSRMLKSRYMLKIKSFRAL
jgi:hypothetical protein